MKRALVLGGGGVAGVAWEGGMLEGFAEGGVPLEAADVIVGTSSGAFMGVRLAAGIPAPEVFAAGREFDVTPPLHPDGVDAVCGAKLWELWRDGPVMDEARLAAIGAVALAARTVDEATLLARTGARIEVDDWPQGRDVRVTAVDVVTGRLRVFDRNCGEPLQSCVTASVALPVLMPPMTVGAHRYMDGGVRSGTNADVLLPDAPDAVVIVAPIDARTVAVGAASERSLVREIAELEAGGARTLVVRPDEQDVIAFGEDLMDTAHVEASRERGYKRGLELAARITSLWRA